MYIICMYVRLWLKYNLRFYHKILLYFKNRVSVNRNYIKSYE